MLDEFASASRRAALPSRRHLARFFLEIRRIESAAQENAARLEASPRLAPSRRRDQTFLASRDEATILLLRGQCNDPYWHGVFGGLYSPHLRTAVWRSLAEAEALADLLSHRKHQYVDMARLDFDADGREEIYLTSDRYAALLKPDDGATFPRSISARPTSR